MGKGWVYDITGFVCGKTDRMVHIVEPCQGTRIPVHGTIGIAHEVAWVGWQL